MEFNTKVNNTPKDFYRNGISFMKAAWRCYGKETEGQYRIIDGGEFCQLTAPAVVNAAFACEMFLKALLLHYGISYKKEHVLINLFDMLPDDTKDKINQFCGMKDDSQVFRNTLSRHSNDCTDIRYYVENEGWSGMDPSYMVALAYNMSQITGCILQC